MAEGAKNRREKAAAARAAAQASERRRERTVRIVGGVVVAAVVVAIIGGAYFVASNQPDAATAGRPVENPEAALPAGVLPAGDPLAYGVPYGGAPESAPQLALWEDFQCPGCGALEAANGSGLTAAAESGQLRLVWRPTGFLDLNLGNDSSKRATAAWGCAIDAGKTKEYHDLIYANQPQEEGVGYPDEVLLDLGKQAGLSGADYDSFAACVDAGTYLEWAGNSTAKFFEEGVGGTPSATLDGVVVDTQQLSTPDALAALLAGGASPAPSAS
jgi:hypothetical protein